MTTTLLALCLLLHLAAADGAADLDDYGGWTDISATATGVFYIETISGRHLLVTPDGHGFIALGVNHLGAIKTHGPAEADLFTERYQSDWQQFAREVLRQYQDWGFNTVDDTVVPLRAMRPYLAARNFVRTAKYYGKPGEKNTYEFPDVFDPTVKARLEQEVGSFCRQHRDNKRLIAYYWTDTPTWDIHKTRRFRDTDWVSEIRRLSAGSPGRERYAAFLRDGYDNDLARLNRAYGLRLESFDKLAKINLGGLDLNRYEIERDDQEFLGQIAQTYYGIVGPAMRRHDPRHLVFGEKYLLGDTPPQVIQAAMPHIDAIAVQPGDGYFPIYTPGDIYPTAEIEALHKLTGKPIFICDHQISFATERYPVAIWPYHQRPNEADAAPGYPNGFCWTHSLAPMFLVTCAASTSIASRRAAMPSSWGFCARTAPPHTPCRGYPPRQPCRQGARASEGTHPGTLTAMPTLPCRHTIIPL